MGSRFKADGARPWNSHDYQKRHICLRFCFWSWLSQRQAITADKCQTAIQLCPRKPGSLLPKTRDVMKGLASSGISQCKGPRERCNLTGPRREISRNKKTEGIKVKAAAQSPPIPTFLLLWLLPDGVLFPWSVMQQDTASWFCRFESPGL